jgi:hypothetical protein
MDQAFSVDLASAAADHLKMLRKVHTCGLDLYRAGSDLERAVEMYKQWLPTADVDDGAAENVHPPIEVIWVHHLHRLNPTAYREDCLRCLGRIVHVEKPFAFSSSPCTSASTSASAGSTYPADGSIEISFDIGEAAQRQSTFLWQVSPLQTLIRTAIRPTQNRFFSFAMSLSICQLVTTRFRKLSRGPGRDDVALVRLALTRAP